MNIIQSENVGLAWLKYLDVVVSTGTEYFDEEHKIIELSDILITIQSDIDDDPILMKYADNHLKKLYLEKMESIDIVKELNASYGYRVFGLPEVNQYDDIKKKLQAKPETKSATIALLLPKDPGPKIPCLTTVDFKLRDGFLYTKTFFRSQNALNAYGNFCALFWLAKKMANDLGVKTGNIVNFISNGHIYHSELERAKSIINSAEV
jgi:thymidylate synthase